MIAMNRMCVCTQACLTLCHPMEGSPPGSLVHAISQARILEWVAVSFSSGSSWPRDQTLVSCVSCIGRWILYCCGHLEKKSVLCVWNVWFSFTKILLSRAMDHLGTLQGFAGEICIHLWMPVQGLLPLWSLSGLLQEASELPLFHSLSALCVYESTCPRLLSVFNLGILLPEFSMLNCKSQF